jgi:hypothetical protein
MTTVDRTSAGVKRGGLAAVGGLASEALGFCVLRAAFWVGRRGAAELRVTGSGVPVFDTSVGWFSTLRSAGFRHTGLLSFSIPLHRLLHRLQHRLLQNSQQRLAAHARERVRENRNEQEESERWARRRVCECVSAPVCA